MGIKNVYYKLTLLWICFLKFSTCYFPLIFSSFFGALFSSSSEYGSLNVPGNGQATITATITGLRPITGYLIRVCGATLHNGQRQWGNCTDFLEQVTLTAGMDFQI